jgi:hypothetical protein
MTPITLFAGAAMAEVCADCGVDTNAIGEWYMVKDDVWEQAWAGRRRLPYGQEILCIGCLEQRLGRTLMNCDFMRVDFAGFADEPINDDPPDLISDRLYDRMFRS